MKIVEFATKISLSIDNENINLKPKSLYLFSDIIQHSFTEQTKKVISKKLQTNNNLLINQYFNKIIKYEKKLEDVLTPFDIRKPYDKKMTKLVIMRTGGIGDLIALSSLSYNLPEISGIPYDNVYFVSQNKYKDVFKWFKRPLKFVSYFSPIASYKKRNAMNKKKLIRNIRPIFFEGVIENHNINWYLLQYGCAGITSFKSEWGRPYLREDRISNEPSRIDKSKFSILINPRSTAIIRSMRLQDIYDALIEIIGDKDCNIYIHKRNLRPQDFLFINSIQSKDDRIKVIEAKSLNDFFLDVYDADLTISVDTAMLHFRDGVKKSAIGIYGPFTTEIRTKFYKYTHSFDIKSKCPNMPCFIHVKHWNACCPFQTKLESAGEYDKKWHEYAPCCCGEWNKNLHEQLVNNMKNYILNILK